MVRSNGGGVEEAVGWSAAIPENLRPPPVVIPPLSETNLRISAPAPRHRDVMNESANIRMKRDLLQLLGEMQAQMVIDMDRRRDALSREGGIAKALVSHYEKKEDEIWEKIHAAELLIKYLGEMEEE